jgi:transcriptional regulator with XRE-family HTH domain
MTRRLRALSVPLPPQPTAAEVCADFEPYRLIQARQLAMLSRADIAAHVGVPAWQVLHWESGVSVPKAYQLEKLAEATDMIVPFFKRGRPMPRITEADCHFRPCAYGR